MNLDKILNGVLDQGNGCLTVFDEPEGDVSTNAPSPTISHRICFNLLTSSMHA